MNLLKQEFKPKDVFALVVIAVYTFLAWKGVTTMLNGAVLIIVGFYFGNESNKIDQTPQ